MTNTYSVHNGGTNYFSISGENLIDAIATNFVRIANANHIGNAAGYRLQRVSAAYTPGILGGKGGVTLYIVATGAPLAGGRLDPRPPQTTEVWIQAKPEDLPQEHIFDLNN